MKKILSFLVVGMIILVLLCICPTLSSSSEKITLELNVPQVSDELDIRFQQVFYKQLDEPTVKKTDLDFLGYESQGAPSFAFRHTYDDEWGMIKGAFYFIEPPYNTLVLDLEDSVIRGIYDIGYNMKGNYYHYSSFRIQYEEENAKLRDLELSFRVPSLLPQNQIIPLKYEESSYIADFNAIRDIVVNDIEECPFILTGVLEYQGMEYPFKTKF